MGLKKNEKKRKEKRRQDRKIKRTMWKNKRGNGKENQMTTLRSDTGEDIRHPWPPFRGIIILSTSCLKKVITKHKMKSFYFYFPVYVFVFVLSCILTVVSNFCF